MMKAKALFRMMLQSLALPLAIGGGAVLLCGLIFMGVCLALNVRPPLISLSLWFTMIAIVLSLRQLPRWFNFGQQNGMGKRLIINLMAGSWLLVSLGLALVDLFWQLLGFGLHFEVYSLIHGLSYGRHLTPGLALGNWAVNAGVIFFACMIVILVSLLMSMISQAQWQLRVLLVLIFLFAWQMGHLSMLIGPSAYHAFIMSPLLHGFWYWGLSLVWLLLMQPLVRRVEPASFMFFD